MAPSRIAPRCTGKRRKKKLQNFNNWNIFLSKNCLFLTPFRDRKWVPSTSGASLEREMANDNSIFTRAWWMEGERTSEREIRAEPLIPPLIMTRTRMEALVAIGLVGGWEQVWVRPPMTCNIFEEAIFWTLYATDLIVLFTSLVCWLAVGRFNQWVIHR